MLLYVDNTVDSLKQNKTKNPGTSTARINNGIVHIAELNACLPYEGKNKRFTK